MLNLFLIVDSCIGIRGLCLRGAAADAEVNLCLAFAAMNFGSLLQTEITGAPIDHIIALADKCGCVSDLVLSEVDAHRRTTALAFEIIQLDERAPFIPNNTLIHCIQKRFSLGCTLSHAALDVTESLLPVHDGSALEVGWVNNA
ncbi:MAG: hypothetical protein LIO52_00285 [Oscillospiraceae bacterium]|nr:hypothetical protein [Oscillospiraceae bacterium]